MRHLSICGIWLTLAAAAWSWNGHAQTPTPGDFPARPLRVVTSTPPGGFLDVVARQIADKLAPALGHAVIVEAKPSAGGVIAMETVARSAPDGHTIGVCSMGELVVNPSLYARLPYDPLKDFAPVILLFSGPQLIVTQPTFAASSIPELIALAKTSPGKLTYGTSGIGTPPHLFTEQFRSIAGIDVVHVPYKGSPAAVAAVLSGEVNVLMEGTDLVVPHVKAGRLKVLAVNRDTRLASLPDVPTLGEVGVPGMARAWVGIVAPAGAPRAVVERLNQEITRALQSPDIKAYYDAAGRTMLLGSPDDFAVRIRQEIPRWAEFIKKHGITPN